QERKAAQMAEMRKEAQEEASNTVNMREVEDAAIGAMIRPLKMIVHEISADGHCLYNAIADQLRRHNAPDALSYKDLRKLAAEEMRANSNDYLPFLVDDNGDMLTPGGFEKYCSDLTNTAVWGGQLEIRALSKALQRQIHVVQMNTPLLKIGEEMVGEPLTLSYHRHAYGLGEHYNSLISSP
ncbi:hypothetical protein BDK51DRAFT_18214, partial [Blyttiomyces helicus]